MPVGFRIEDEGSKILIWNLSETCEELLRMLGAVDMAEYDRFSATKRKREYLAARVALKTLLGREVCVKYTSEGKPYIENDVHLSITHSADRVGVMVNEQIPVGIDVELASPKIEHLYQRFMGVDEQADFNNGADIRQLQIVWSAKEAMYKILGKVAVDFASQLRVMPFLPDVEGKIECIHLPENNRYLLSYRFDGDYTLVYCKNEIKQ